MNSFSVASEFWQRSVIPKLIHHPDYVFLTSGRVLCIAGNAMTPIVMAFLTLDKFHAPSALGFVMAARGFSVIAFLLVGGIVSDRFPRRSVLCWSGSVTGVSQALVTTLALTGHVHLWQLMLLQVPNGAAASFLFPAMNAMLPQTIPIELRRPAIAVSRTGMNAAMIGGAALSGTVVASIGSEWASAINSATYFTGVLAFAGIRLRSAGLVRSTGASMIANLAEGWKEFRSRTWLWATVVQFSVVNAAVAVGFETLGPVIAKLYLGGARSWGLIVAAQGAGLVLGAMIAAAWKPSRPLRVGWIAIFALVPAFATLALHIPLPATAAAAILCGVGLEVFGLNWDSTMQHEIPPDQLSRMYSYDAFGSNASIPAGQIAMAPCEALMGVNGLVWLSGLLVAATAATGILAASRLPRQVVARPLPNAPGN